MISHKKSLCFALTDRVINHTAHSGGRSHFHLRLLWDMLRQNGSSDATEAPMERQLYLTVHLLSVHVPTLTQVRTGLWRIRSVV